MPQHSKCAQVTLHKSINHSMCHIIITVTVHH